MIVVVSTTSADFSQCLRQAGSLRDSVVPTSELHLRRASQVGQAQVGLSDQAELGMA